jgi:hypothetical protein
MVDEMRKNIVNNRCMTEQSNDYNTNCFTGSELCFCCDSVLLIPVPFLKY